jgi:hypothetical protein
MKTKQNKIDRSGAKWLPGAMALAATAASSQAATVQITLTGNKISSPSAGGDSLNADLTGDNVNDVLFMGRAAGTRSVTFAMEAVNFSWRPNGNALAFVDDGGRYAAKPGFVSDGVGSGGIYGAVGPIPARSYLNPIKFTDTRINDGNRTDAWLEVTAFNESATSHTLQLTRLIFDDASTTRPAFSSIPGEQTAWTAVPEPSSFALLALGAGGLIARRRRQAA